MGAAARARSRGRHADGAFPQVETGEEVDDEQLEQAVEIIRQRVDGTGVAEAEIAVQGSENIVVNLPGTPDEATRELIQASADMEFRPVLQQGMTPSTHCSSRSRCARTHSMPLKRT